MPTLEPLIEEGAIRSKVLELADQARVWSLREAALGLSMAMKDEAKSISFVEDTAVAPEKLRDYIDRFLQIIRKHSEGDVIVSLLGPPILNDEQRGKLGENRPRIVAVCAGALPEQVNLRQLFDQHLLHAAVISRSEVGPAAAGSPREAFNQFYQLITPANLSELPRLTGTAAK